MGETTLLNTKVIEEGREEGAPATGADEGDYC